MQDSNIATDSSDAGQPELGSPLSSAACQQIFNACGYPDAVIVGMRATALAVSGAVADMTRLHFNYEQPRSGPASAIAKARATEGHRLLMDQAMGLHARESWFYSNWRDRVALRSPRCFDVGTDPASTLLLEDLGPLRSGDQVTGLRLQDAEVLMDALAGQHAAFWMNESCDDPHLATATDSNYVSMVHHLVNTGVESLVARYGDRAPAAALDAVARLAPRWTDVVTACAAGPRTVAHNDCRLDNIFFDGEGNPVFIDWQAIGTTRGTHDIANLLAGSMDIDLLRAHWKELVRRYHRRLCEHGVTGYSWERCEQDYRQSVLFPLGQGIALVGALDRHDGRGLTDPAVLRPLLHCHDLDAFATV